MLTTSSLEALYKSGLYPEWHFPSSNNNSHIFCIDIKKNT